MSIASDIIKNIVKSKALSRFNPGDVYTGTAWRVPTFNMGNDAKTAADVIRFEANELGNTHVLEHAFKAAKKHSLDLNNISADDIVWVTRNKRTAEKLYGYGEKASRWQIPKNSIVLSDIGDDGILLYTGDTGIIG